MLSIYDRKPWLVDPVNSVDNETHKTVRLKLVMRTEFYIDANTSISDDKWDMFAAINDWEVQPHDLCNEDKFTITHSHCSVDQIKHLEGFDPQAIKLALIAK